MECFSAFEWLLIDIANRFGLDQSKWQQRLDWALNHLKDNSWPANEEAKEPFMYAKARMELGKARMGLPSGHVVGLDANSSGLQILACLTGCHTTAKHVGLIDTGKLEKVYKLVAETMNTQFGTNYSGADCKSPVMTHFYGSKEEPKNTFGEDTEELKAFYAALEEIAPGPCEAMRDMLASWQPYEPYHCWTLPDGFEVVKPVSEMVDSKIEVDELGHATFTHRMEVFQGTEQGLSIAADVTHSVDAYVVREMVRRAREDGGFTVLTIHDEFKCLPAYVNLMRMYYREILAEIAESDLLSDIISQIRGTPVKFKKFGDGRALADLIRHSEYAIS